MRLYSEIVWNLTLQISNLARFPHALLLSNATFCHLCSWWTRKTDSFDPVITKCIAPEPQAYSKSCLASNNVASRSSTTAYLSLTCKPLRTLRKSARLDFSNPFDVGRIWKNTWSAFKGWACGCSTKLRFTWPIWRLQCVWSIYFSPSPCVLRGRWGSLKLADFHSPAKPARHDDAHCHPPQWLDQIVQELPWSCSWFSWSKEFQYCRSLHQSFQMKHTWIHLEELDRVWHHSRGIVQLFWHSWSIEFQVVMNFRRVHWQNSESCEI